MKGKAAFNCPNCGAFAKQTWFELSLQVPNTGQYLSTNDRIDRADRSLRGLPEPISSWAQAECAACHRFSTWRRSTLIYPRSNTLPLAHADMPEDVVDLYNEARDVAAVSKRAGAAMARATLEKLLRVLLENDKDQLIDLIDQVEPLVDMSTADLLMYVRHVGNSALHVKDAPDAALVLVLDDGTEAAMNALFETVNRLVEQLISRPAQTALLTNSVPVTVKAKVEQLRAKRQQQDS